MTGMVIKVGIPVGVPGRILHGMVADAAMRWPNEACGVVTHFNGPVTSSWSLIPITNADPSGRTFKFEPHEQLKVWQDMERSGQELFCIYHSHPAGQARPSDYDLSVSMYPTRHFIIGRQNLEQDNPDSGWIIQAFSNFEYSHYRHHPIKIIQDEVEDDWFWQRFMPTSPYGMLDVVWEV